MHTHIIYIYIYGPSSSVGIATELPGPARPGWTVRDWILLGDEIFRPSRPALGPTQSPVKWVPGLSRGKVRPERTADHSPLLVPQSWRSRAIPLPTLRACKGINLYIYIYVYIYIFIYIYTYRERERESRTQWETSQVFVKVKINC